MLEQAAHVWHAEGKLTKRIVTSKPNKKRPVGRLRQCWIDRVRNALKGLREEARIEDPENREYWRSLIKAVKGLWPVKQKRKNYLIETIKIIMI